MQAQDMQAQLQSRMENRPRQWRSAAIRALDVAFSAGVLIALSPLYAALALLIRLRDGRPVLYRQPRIGKNGRPFQILKFRSMRPQGRGGLITAANDARVTPTGKWMRRYKLDELPQFFNVLRGEMSLIGPRPEVPPYVDFRDGLWRTVLHDRPGITDLASLIFRNEEALLAAADDPESYYRSVLLPAKLELNCEYQRSRTFARDLTLLWMTARYGFVPRGFDPDRVARRFGAQTPLCIQTATDRSALHA